ncbi:MAG: hypothetical protein JNM93_11640 [Bacteriovoracaceae bacterium]|nr:hypothetical protein [Bacteriovoracaceae bacterium]
MKFIKPILAIYLSLAFTVTGQAKPVFEIDKTETQIIHEYLEVHQGYFKKLCTYGSDHEYYKLLRNFRGQGYYLPESKGDVDSATITKYLPKILDKINYIKDIKAKLMKQRSLPSFRKITDKIIDIQKKALNEKKNYQLASTEKQRLTALNSSRKLLAEYEVEYNAFVNNIYFLLSFDYPVDHFYNRKNYDKYKDLGDTYKVKANELYFYRKIVEDGALDPDHTKSDAFLRSALDTVTLAVKNQRDFFSENIRYDMDYIIGAVEGHIDRGYALQVKRLNEWEDRTKKSYDYYLSVLKDTKLPATTTNADGLTRTQFLMKQKAEATFALRDYVYKKEAAAFEFWSQQTELMKALFVIETILFNEVGEVDGREATERKDVTQVVINRHDIPFYQKIDPTEDLYTYLLRTFPDAEIQKQHWLNVLFKKGEFSFTYYYIPGVVNIFCPDQSRIGQFLRKENLRLAYRKLIDPDRAFTATRYFSRASMTGRIDMSQIWGGYAAISERPGVLHKNQVSLRRAFKNLDYQYYYSFIAPNSESYQVVNIDDETYTLKLFQDNPIFYHYRNPHYFTYFVKD